MQHTPPPPSRPFLTEQLYLPNIVFNKKFCKVKKIVVDIVAFAPNKMNERYSTGVLI
jgi:hypothetical protein